MDLLSLRVLERVLAVLIGGMSIFLGYRLFIKLPRQKDSSGKVMLPGDSAPRPARGWRARRSARWRPCRW